MPLVDPADSRPVHFVGIAGAGMSALAELFVTRGVTVTGCDAAGDPTGDLGRLGISVSTGHDPSHVEGARAVVVTSALPKTHPELQRARELGIPVIRRAEALGEAVSGGDLVAIAGTHGKTTTTVMTTEALQAAGLQPTGVVGGRVGSWGGNLRYGSDRVFVVEADEYDRSFLALTPTVAVITNVEADHLDIYADLADIHRTFEQFASPARTIVLCGDDAGANGLTTPSSAEIIRYGIHSRDARLLAVDVRSEGGGSIFEVEFDDEMLGEVELSVPGLHNVMNALAAIASGLTLGATLEAMRPGLAAFRGVERRFSASEPPTASTWWTTTHTIRPRFARRWRRPARRSPAAASSQRSSLTSSREHATSRGSSAKRSRRRMRCISRISIPRASSPFPA
jgi:UDP-N-acetylmuramate--alanine ligase